MTYSSLKHPDVRKELVNRLSLLSDKKRQWEEWSSSSAKHRFWDYIRFSVESLFDDLALLDDPQSQIGYSIYDIQELEAVCDVAKKLYKVVDQIGVKQPDSPYMKDALWEEVMRASEKAYGLLKENDEKLK